MHWLLYSHGGLPGVVDLATGYECLKHSNRSVWFGLVDARFLILPINRAACGRLWRRGA
jgi:hypothetical protein